MKWHKSRKARWRATFEALENRKLFAADVAEVVSADLFSSEIAPSDDAALVADVSLLAFDPTAETSDATIELTELDEPGSKAYSEIMMMTFRSSEVAEDVVTEDIKLDELPVDPDGIVLMTMSGPAGDLDATPDVRTLSVEEDQVTTAEFDSSEVDASEIRTLDVDEAIADEDLIFYSMGADDPAVDPEVQTTSIDEVLAEDVNGDGSVTAIDMLLIYNALNSYGAVPLSQLAELPEVGAASNWDVNRDGYVTPLDALLLTNYFNEGAGVEHSSSQDLLVAPGELRIRNPADDEAFDESVPPIEDEFDNDVFGSELQ